MATKKTSLENEHPVAYKVGIAILTPPLYSALVIVLIPVSLFCAWCDMRIWNWFLAPYFHFAALTIWPAFGFNLWLGSHQYRPMTYRDDERRVRWWLSYYLLLLSHLMMLAIGWGVYRWAVR